MTNNKDCRMAFEEWAAKNDLSLFMNRPDDQRYWHAGTETAWQAFQAAWQQSRQGTQAAIEASDAKLIKHMVTFLNELITPPKGGGGGSVSYFQNTGAGGGSHHSVNRTDVNLMVNKIREYLSSLPEEYRKGQDDE